MRHLTDAENIKTVFRHRLIKIAIGPSLQLHEQRQADAILSEPRNPVDRMKY
jgi:hypothetical protein